MDRAGQISETFNSLRDVVLEKNKRYGDSALNPIGIFSRNNIEANLYSRADDKISRIKNREGDKIRLNDLSDLVGYLILIIIQSQYTSDDIKKLID